MQVIVDGLLTNYEQIGSGKAVLLLHGWGDSLETFKGLQKKLAGNYKTIALDLPGFGKTDAPKKVWGLENYAGFIYNFLNKIGVENLYAIIGHSNGGALVIVSVANGVLAPEKIILLAASGIRDKQKTRRLLTKAVAKTGKVATFWLSTEQKKKLQKKLYGVVGSDMLVVPHLQETFKKTVAQDVQQDASSIKLPTLLIYAEQDKAVPLEYGKIYESLISGSKLIVIDDAGHFVHQDQPAEVEKKIEEFLK